MRLFRRHRLTADASFLVEESDASVANRPYSINAALGGFGIVGVRWEGTSPEDVRNSWLQYLTNHDEFAELDDPELQVFRSLYVNFHGQRRLLTFRTDWVSGFTVH